MKFRKQSTLAVLLVAAVLIHLSGEQLQGQNSLNFATALQRAVEAVKTQDRSIIGVFEQKTKGGVEYDATFHVLGMYTNVYLHNRDLKTSVEFRSVEMSFDQAHDLFKHLKHEIMSVLGDDFKITPGDNEYDFEGSVSVDLTFYPPDPGDPPNSAFVSVDVSSAS